MNCPVEIIETSAGSIDFTGCRCYLFFLADETIEIVTSLLTNCELYTPGLIILDEHSCDQCLFIKLL